MIESLDVGMLLDGRTVREWLLDIGPAIGHFYKIGPADVRAATMIEIARWLIVRGEALAGRDDSRDDDMQGV